MSKENIIHLTVGPIATNCWIYPIGEGTAAIIDPGDEAGVIISALKKASLVPEYILLTHGHFDHITALSDLLDAFNKGILGVDDKEPPKVAIHRQDAHYLEKTPTSVQFIEEGDTVGPFRILHIPGHTQGCVGYFDEKAGVLFTGDTLFQGDYGRTDLPGGNEKQIHESLKRLLSLDGEILVYPGHGPTTIIKEEDFNFSD